MRELSRFASVAPGRRFRPLQMQKAHAGLNGEVGLISRGGVRSGRVSCLLYARGQCPRPCR